jgi:trehalose 6-phosphate phosphatase
VQPLDRLAAEPERAAVLLDVDGVLAPIVARPEDARVPDTTKRELERLAGSYALVGCVTGRPSAAARAIVGVPGLTIVGEHGLELDPEAPAWAERIAAFADAAAWPAERKPYTLAFHYRTADDPEAARAVLEEVEAHAQAAGFRTRWGRMLLEVLPPLDASKGTAVRRLLEERRLDRALYAGDDTTDLDAFAALRALVEEKQLAHALCVGVRSDETPPELEAQADLLVDGPLGVRTLLSALAA